MRVREWFWTGGLWLLTAAPVGSNGESVWIEHDPRTGVIYPMRKSVAEVRRQKLVIRFDPPFARIQTEYVLYNPTSRPERLHIAFAIPGNATLTRPPVFFDGKMLSWRYQSVSEVYREVFPVIRTRFEQVLKRYPLLRQALERAYQASNAKPYDNDALARAQDALEQVLKKTGCDRFDLAVDEWLDAYRDYQFGEVSSRAIERVLIAVGERKVLPAYRWNALPRYLDPRTGALREGWSTEHSEEIEYASSAYGAVSLLHFEITLQPRQQHGLRVQYEQLAGHGYWTMDLADRLTLSDYLHLQENPSQRYDLTYLLRTQSWAKYGAIDIEVYIPPDRRLRTRPATRYVGVQNGMRRYTARITNPRDNLYIVVGSPELFRTHEQASQGEP